MALPLVSLCSSEVALSIFQHPRAYEIWNTPFTWCFVIMWEWQQFRTHLQSWGCQHAAESIVACMLLANWGQWRAAHILCELLSHFRIIWNWFSVWLDYGRCRYGLRSLCWAMRWLRTIQHRRVLVTVCTFSAWRKVKDRTHILGIVDADERNTQQIHVDMARRGWGCGRIS